MLNDVYVTECDDYNHALGETVIRVRGQVH